MPETNFKLFDENKGNMMSDTDYDQNTARLNGVQGGWRVQHSIISSNIRTLLW